MTDWQDIPKDELEMAAQCMTYDLDHEFLKVELIPGEYNNGRKIRVATSQNPLWYQGLCAEYMTIYKRRLTTYIRRPPTTALWRK